MSSTRKLAVAFDLGTTTIAASLVEVGSGARLAALGALNPQRPWGGDVLSRLDAASSPETLVEMRQCTALELERLALQLVADAGARAEDLVGVGIAGNPAMEHILLGLPVKSLVHPPYRPLFSAGRRLSTTELGWSLPLEAYLFPLPGGFVGGDLVAFLFSRATCDREPTLYLDLGTNGELALFDGERYLATSAAAGPAFEGGNLSCGMAALPGAISSVAFEGERLLLTTIGGGRPQGICGSAVIETIAGLLDAGVLERSGRLRGAEEVESNLANRLTRMNGVPAFVLHRDAYRTVYLSQEDIRAFQLAKGALRAGMEALLQRAGLDWERISRVVLTGSFGAVLAPGVLKKVGVFTEKMIIISGFVREGALCGVERLFSEENGPQKLEELASRVRVFPLSGTPLFERLFMESIDFP